MDNLQHDPRTKQQIKDALYSYLYEPVQRQFKNRIDDLIIRNTLLGGYSHKSFIYKGVVYDCDIYQPPLKKNRLVKALHEEMETYLADLKQLNDLELPYVLGFINQVLNSSDGLHDYLRLLPDAVHSPLKQLITSCPCKDCRLSDEKVQLLKEKNQASIDLMRQRMVTNLLI